MPWKELAAFGALLFVLGAIDERLAVTVGVAALAVLALRNPDAIMHPFG